MIFTKTSLSICLVTLLAACGGGGDSDTTSAGSTSSSGSSAASSLAPDFPNLQACIANTWVMGGEQIRRGLDAVGDGVTSVSGNNTSVFSANGSYRGTPAYTINFTRGGTSATSQYSGTALGTWAVDGDRLIITRTSSSVTVTNTIGGVTTSYTSPTGSPSTVKVISCKPTTLTYDQTLSTGTVVRIVLVSG